MQRRQKKLWEQRRLTLTRRQREKHQNELREQFRVRTSVSSTVNLWWSCDDGNEETLQGNTSWKWSCNQLANGERSGRRNDRALAKDEYGCRCESMRCSFKPTESWKTLSVEKACNRTCQSLDELAVDDVRNGDYAGSASHGRQDEDRHVRDVEVQACDEVKRS
eukprot:jgi/Phyca11/112783/e_gw1.23.245.1